MRTRCGKRSWLLAAEFVTHALTLAADPERFDELMTALERDQFSDEVWRQLAERIEKWPAEVERKVPTPWLDDPRFVPFRTHRCWSLCNTLKLSGPLNPVVATQLAECEWLSSIQRLYVSSSVLGEDLEIVLAAPVFTEVTSLSVVNNRVSAKPATAIATSFPKLRSLTLGWTDLGDTGIDTLLEGEWTTTLERLTVFHSLVEAAGAEQIARTNWPRLQRLSLNNNALGLRGALAIVRAKTMQSLRELSLRDCGINEDEAAALMRAIPDSLHLTLA